VDPRVRALVTALASHEPVDAIERDAIARLRRLVAAPADPFARTTLPAHITASAVVLDPDHRMILLHLHRRLGRWLQPGGHVETGERPEDAAVRETREETGSAVRHPIGGPHILHLDEHPGPDGHIHLDLRYLLLVRRSEPALGAGEATGEGPGASLRWAELPEVAVLTDRSLARAIVALEHHLEHHLEEHDGTVA